MAQDQYNIKFDSWKINTTNIITDITSPFKYILNNYDSSFDVVSRYIHDIALFHMEKQKINFDKNMNCIEFSIVNESDSFTIEYNKKMKTYPLFTILTFLHDESNPIIFTEIDLESYKYKEINNENTFIILLPTTNTQIVFDSSKYYGFYKNIYKNNNNNKILKINIWNTMITEIPIYKLSEKVHTDETVEQVNIIQLNYEKYYNKIVYSNIINDFLYEENKINTVLENLILKYQKNTKIMITNSSLNFYDINYLKEQYGDNAYDLFPFINLHTDIAIDIEKNRFVKNKIFKNILSKDVCYWIMNEAEKHDFKISKYNNYSNYLNIENIPSVLNFILYVSNFWLMEIKKQYNIENVELNIFECFIAKYKKDIINQDMNNDGMNNDGCFLSLNIYLNEFIEYKDGEIIFENNEDKFQIGIGDGLLYNGKKNRTNGNVSDGIKYILVLLINIAK